MTLTKGDNILVIFLLFFLFSDLDLASLFDSPPLRICSLRFVVLYPAGRQT